MKKITIILVVMIMCLMFTACDSENVKAAKEAMSNKDYNEAIEYLEKEDNLDENGIDLLEKAKANEAFVDGNYDKTIIHIIKTSDGKECELYEEAKKKLIGMALKNGEFEQVVVASNVDSDFCKYAVKRVKKACNDLNYNGFKILDGMKSGIKDKDIRSDLRAFYEKNKLNKPKAYLFGDWRWDKGGKKTETIVEVITYKNDLIATVIQVGDDEKEYQIKKDDVYWSDFEFIDEEKFTCTSLCKTRDGMEVQCTTVGRMDYSKDIVKMHLTPPSPFNMDSESADRIYKKIK